MEKNSRSVESFYQYRLVASVMLGLGMLAASIVVVLPALTEAGWIHVVVIGQVVAPLGAALILLALILLAMGERKGRKDFERYKASEWVLESISHHMKMQITVR